MLTERPFLVGSKLGSLFKECSSFLGLPVCPDCLRISPEAVQTVLMTASGVLEKAADPLDDDSAGPMTSGSVSSSLSASASMHDGL